MRRRRTAVVLLLSVACFAAIAAAQERRAPPLPPMPAEPAWPEAVVGTLRTFFERVALDEVMADLRPPEPAPPPEQFLGGDWLAPFRWVQQAVRFEPYFGSLRGPQGAAMSRGANALDRSLLLAWLYEQRGVETRLVRGHLGWPDVARLTPATLGSQALDPGDPVLRLVELTSDHWWVEARRDGGWMALDTAFAGLGPGETRAARREVSTPQSLSPALLAAARIEVLGGERTLLQLDGRADVLAGGVVRLAALTAAEIAAEIAPEPSPEDVAAGEAGPQEQEGEPEEAPDPVLLALPTYPVESLLLRLRTPLGSHDIGPLSAAELLSVRLRVRVQAPLGLPTEVTVPWGGGVANQILVRVEPGRVGPDRLAAVAAPVYAALRELAAAEEQAAQAYLERPRAGDEVASEVDLGLPMELQLATAIAGEDATEDAEAGEADAGEVELEAWTRLHLAALGAWDGLAGRILDATAVASLAAVDMMTPVDGVARPGVRLLGLHWRPPDPLQPGRMTLWLDDPAMVGGGSGARRELLTAHGLLSSAMLGQVLNRIADRPPLGAFDVTLRAVGTGSRLSWWHGRGPEAPPWPDAGAAAARDDVRRGRYVVGPQAPLSVAGATLLGWWAWDRDSGAIGGRVLGPLGTAQASVEFGAEHDLANLDSALASVVTLHDAARWLVLAADPERPELRELLPRACAATALVRDLMLAGAPDGWRDPRFAELCAR